MARYKLSKVIKTQPVKEIRDRIKSTKERNFESTHTYEKVEIIERTTRIYQAAFLDCGHQRIIRNKHELTAKRLLCDECSLLQNMAIYDENGKNETQ